MVAILIEVTSRHVNDGTKLSDAQIRACLKPLIAQPFQKAERSIFMSDRDIRLRIADEVSHDDGSWVHSTAGISNRGAKTTIGVAVMHNNLIARLRNSDEVVEEVLIEHAKRVLDEPITTGNERQRGVTRIRSRERIAFRRKCVHRNPSDNMVIFKVTRSPHDDRGNHALVSRRINGTNTNNVVTRVEVNPVELKIAFRVRDRLLPCADNLDPLVWVGRAHDRHG